MGQILIRQLDDDARERLKERAERNGRSLEAEAREILKAAAEHERTRRKSAPGFGTRIAGRFKGIGLTRSELEGFNRAIDKARKRARAIRQVQTMIVVDSNVASEMMAEEPEPRVIAWLDSLEPERLWLNAVTVFEIKRGIDDLDPGRRKRALLSAFDALVVGDFDNRVLPFDLPAAIHAAQIDIDRKRLGRPVGFADTQIAGIAVSRGAAIATRNVRHFDDLSVELINPWDAPV